MTSVQGVSGLTEAQSTSFSCIVAKHPRHLSCGIQFRKAESQDCCDAAAWRCSFVEDFRTSLFASEDRVWKRRCAFRKLGRFPPTESLRPNLRWGLITTSLTFVPRAAASVAGDSIFSESALANGIINEEAASPNFEVHIMVLFCQIILFRGLNFKFAQPAAFTNRQYYSSRPTLVQLGLVVDPLIGSDPVATVPLSRKN
mmetsp:Transcript_57659/g.172027  ORF Transcript_57659/g.172027 Transcript_57659/m.172027 type:complete len:200 (+) Transcript_57659:2455-3054(+)